MQLLCLRQSGICKRAQFQLCAEVQDVPQRWGSCVWSFPLCSQFLFSLVPLLTPSVQREGCSASWWSRSSQALPPQLGLSTKACRLRLPWSCHLLLTVNVEWKWGWTRHWHQWSMVAMGYEDWLALLKSVRRQNQLSLGSADGQLSF